MFQSIKFKSLALTLFFQALCFCAIAKEPPKVSESVVVTPQNMDFGKVLRSSIQGDELIGEFTVQNKTSQKLEITEIKARCGCAALDKESVGCATLDKESLRLDPKESSKIRVRVSVRGVYGTKKVRVILKLSDGRLSVVEINCDIVSDFFVTPQVITIYEDLMLSKTLEKSLSIYRPSIENKPKIISIESPSYFIQFKEISDKGAFNLKEGWQEYRLKLTLKAGSDVLKAKGGHVLIKFEDNARIEIPIKFVENSFQSTAVFRQ
jgi:hypothetical protein